LSSLVEIRSVGLLPIVAIEYLGLLLLDSGVPMTLSPEAGCPKLFTGHSAVSQKNIALCLELSYNRFIDYPFRFTIH
jgi:hypothetical protein